MERRWRLVLSAALGAAALLTGHADAGPREDALLSAVSRDSAGRVEELLAEGVDPNTRNPAGFPALQLALREGSARAAAVLIKARGIALEATNSADETALMTAALKGEVDSVRRLIAAGARVNREGWTPLQYAAAGPSTAAVEALLAAGAIVDAPSPSHTTALMMAARYGPESSVDRLLAAGADPTAVNDHLLDAAGFARDAERASLAAKLAKLGPP